MDLRTKSVEELAEDVRARTTELPSWEHPAVATYVMVVGAGFSVPSIPLTSTIVREEIGEYDFEPGIDAEGRHGRTRSQRERTSERFWREFNEGLSPPERLALNIRGLPVDHAEAYRRLFSVHETRPDFLGGTPKGSAYLKEFQLRLLRPGSARLNAAHDLLARLMRSQVRGELQGRRPFCQRILTTNFDTLLQQALQRVQVLYLIDSRPGSGFNPRDFADPPDAIHLVYIHGMALGYNPANTDAEIARLRDLNATVLVPLLERHGVIVAGFNGGWRDTLMDALSACRKFRHGLYWCDIHSAEDAEDRLDDEVLSLLQRSDERFYVPLGVGGAEDLMRALVKTLDPAALSDE